MIDYNTSLQMPWAKLRSRFIYQTNCLRTPLADNGVWDLNLPSPHIQNDQIVVLHCQDFLNYIENGVRELLMIENHFGSKANRVIVITWEIDMHERYNGIMHLAYFPSHTFNIIVNLRQCLDLWQPKLLGERNKHFQCLNGIPRPHREIVVPLLDKLSSPSVITLGPNRIHNFSPKGVENEQNYINLLDVYGNCDINVVTETVYYERPGIITEKTLFALMSLQVPLFIGYQGLVEQVKKLGFDVFEDVVDISYDWLPNETRIHEAIRRNESILRNGIDRKKLHQRLQSNQQLVLNWPEKMVRDYHHRCLEIQDVLAID